MWASPTSGSMQAPQADATNGLPADLRAPPRPHLLPFCLIQVRQMREHARALQPPATVDGDAIAVNVAGLIGYEIGGEIGEFAMLSGAAKRVEALPALSHRCRDQPVPSTFGREGTG